MKKRRVKEKEQVVATVPRIEERKDLYVFTVFGLKGVGGKVYLGTVKNKSRLQVEKMCYALKLELANEFPRGISYEMLEYYPEMEREL